MYIIENANILKDKQLTSCSLLVAEDKIVKIEGSFQHYRLMKMNGEPYIMTPSYVIFKSKIPNNGSYQELKKYIIEEFILKGSTTIFTYVNISYELELTEKINDMVTALISSPIDYIIGVKIPLRLLTPSLIRKCKKEKIPAIFVELENTEQLELIPWGWIREAIFPFNCPLIPIISFSQKKEEKALLSKWKGIMVREKIPSIYEELAEHEPLSIPILNKVGLFPRKSCLKHGSELSYNFYVKGREIKNVDEVKLFHYHGDRLVITVHKGKVIRSGDQVLFKPGFGDHVEVRTPSYFSL